MKHFAIIIASLLSLILNQSCNFKSEKLHEPGISTNLAQFRSENFKNPTYKLFLSIPENADSAILGSMEIIFDFKTKPVEVILDFKVPYSHIFSVTANQISVPFEFKNNHIIIEEKYFKITNNNLTINFQAGEQSLNRTSDFLYTLLVPDRASTAFPCFDQPDLKAYWEVTAEVPNHWIASSNGKLISSKANENKKTVEFEKTKLIPTYLFALSAGNFKRIEKNILGKTFVCYHRETDSLLVAENIEELFELHHQAVKFLEEYTGIMEPFGNFEFTVIPAFQYSGMEHPGNIYYRDTKLFLPKGATESDIMSRASLIAHETAHLWFGDLVTMRWFSDVWLKEVFANYFAAMIVNPNYPDINHDLLFMLKHQSSSYSIDRTAGANPIQQPLENLNFAGTLYGNIIYYKAPIVFKKLHQTAGDSIFKAAIRKYLQRYSYANANWDELIAVFEAHNLPNVSTWSKAWVKEPGMPIVSYTISDSAIHIKSTNSVAGTAHKQQQLEVIISYPSKVEFEKIDLNKPELILPIKLNEKPEYVLLNGSGYEYGYFPSDSVSMNYFLHSYEKIHSDLQRGIVLLNQFEDFLNGQIAPNSYIAFLHRVIKNERSVHLLDLVVNQLKTIILQFNFSKNNALSEELLYEMFEKTEAPAVKKMFLNAYISIGKTEKYIKNMEAIWEHPELVKNLKFSDTELLTMSYELIIKNEKKAVFYFEKAISRLKNPDRKAEAEFIWQAISPDKKIRDQFFYSLKEEKNRAHEPWVNTAIYYLNHPIRAYYSSKYLQEGITMLEEIRATGDIFFPTDWIKNMLWGHTSASEVKETSTYIKQAGIPVSLKNKALQALDLPMRASKIQQKFENY